MRACFRILLALALLCSHAAAGEDLERQVTRLNRRAMENYDHFEYEAARKLLVEAAQLLHSRRLDNSPVAASTFANLGTVYVVGLKDRTRGVASLVAALKVLPTLQLDPALLCPEVEEAFAAAKKQLEKVPPRGRPSEAVAMVHQPVTEATAGTRISLRTTVPAELPVKKMIVRARLFGSARFEASEFVAATTRGEWTVTLAPPAGPSIEYYIEGLDEDGKLIGQCGSAEQPFSVAIKARPVVSTRDHVFLFVMPGFGFGFQPAGNHSEVAWQIQSSGKYALEPIKTGGFLLAPFHLSIEAGAYITPHWTISLLARIQLYSGANAETQPGMNINAATQKATGAFAGLLRVRYRFLDGKFHPYLHLDMGGGQIRHMLDLTESLADQDHPLVDRYTAEAYNNGDVAVAKQGVCANPTARGCVDTVALGYLFVGGGTGIWYDPIPHFSLIFDVTLLGGLGVFDGQYGMNIDAQLGLGTRF